MQSYIPYTFTYRRVFIDTENREHHVSYIFHYSNHQTAAMLFLNPRDRHAYDGSSTCEQASSSPSR